MFPSYTQYEVETTDRRRRFEAEATKRRLLGTLRRRNERHEVAAGGATPASSLRSIPPGRTPGELDRQAA